MPGALIYFSSFGGLLLMPLNFFDNLSDGRAPLVEVLGPILYSKIEAFWEVLDFIFSPSVILIMKRGVPNPPKSP